MTKIQILHFITNQTQTTFQIAQFDEEIFDQGYGLKRFITEIGEVAIINFNSDGISQEMEEINMLYEKMKTEIAVFIPITINDVWRYFADKSASGLIWYLGAMYYTNVAVEEQTNSNYRVISKYKIDVLPQIVTYKKWSSLTEIKKEELMRKFLSKPVNCFSPISLHFSELL
jgi:hypothetical protein